LEYLVFSKVYFYKGADMNIIEMAREAGIKSGDIYNLTVGHMSIETLERFAALVAAHQREACAKVCESYLSVSPYSWGGTTMASAIRARGQA